jgi:hypothetical protein
VKRHPSLIPLSHDHHHHHHALVEARRLRRGADADAAARRATCESFLRFFSQESVRHFRQEEERLFPLLVDQQEWPSDLLTQALLEHQRLHALVDRLDHELALGEPDTGLMQELGRLLEAHVRLEERQLFPLIQETVPDAALSALDLTPREPAKPPVVDGEPHALDQGDALILGKGQARALSAGPDGVRYLSIHRRRGPLQITSPARSGQA